MNANGTFAGRLAALEKVFGGRRNDAMPNTVGIPVEMISAAYMAVTFRSLRLQLGDAYPRAFLQVAESPQWRELLPAETPESTRRFVAMLHSEHWNSPGLPARVLATIMADHEIDESVIWPEGRPKAEETTIPENRGWEWRAFRRLHAELSQ
jgi:hypothetical protein